MDRFSLTDAPWEKMEPFGLGKPTDPGRTGGDARLFLEAMLWIARTGSPWRDLPASFGSWNSVFKRVRDWLKADVFRQMFDAVSDEPDMGYRMVDATSRTGATAVVRGELVMIMDLHRQGLSLTAVGRQLAIDRKTVRRDIALGLERVKPLISKAH